jgi:glycogen phosphorylase
MEKLLSSCPTHAVVDGRRVSAQDPARGDAELFRPLVENLLAHDPFLVLADYESYINMQERVSALWRDRYAWTRQSILNTARMGKFSFDRLIRDYCDRVWKVQPA